jgi:protein-tyrosine phosphatase
MAHRTRKLLVTAAATASLGIGAATLVVPPASAASVTAVARHDSAVRVVTVQGAYNVRDIGGYAGAGGRRVRYGLVYRSGNLSSVTAAGIAQLAALHLTASIDFRSAAEVTADGTDKLPAGVARIADPVDPGLPVSETSLLGVLTSPAVATALMKKAYVGFITDAASRASFGAALRTIADAKGPVLYHCTQGKDRTGLMTAILFRILGVSNQQIYADYLLSNTELAAYNATVIAKLKFFKLNAAAFIPVLTVQSGYLQAAFNQISHQYGSFEKFLVTGLGVTPAIQAKLIKRLL